MSERECESCSLVPPAREPCSLMEELAQKKRELEEVRHECAEVTDKNQQLEVVVGDLVKEVRYLKRVVVELHAGSNAGK